MQFKLITADEANWPQISAAMTLVNEILSTPVLHPVPDGTFIHTEIDITVVTLNDQYMSFYTADSQGYTQLYRWAPDNVDGPWFCMEDEPWPNNLPEWV